MKTRFNHDVRKKCVIVNASELGRLLLLLLLTLLCQHHEYAISCHFPYYFTLYISDNTAKKSELKTKKVGTCQDDDFFALLSTFRAFWKYYGIEWKLVLECITPGHVLQWEVAKWNLYGCGTEIVGLLTKWPMGMSENWWYTTHWTPGASSW